jgi:beta-galactosidase
VDNPPNAPTTFNPIGKYRKTFQVPEDWDGRQVLVHFEAVDSAFYLFVNGFQVGYSQGSRTPAEFDITPFLVAGEEQVIAAEVYRWNVGSWIEDQDIWRLSGIFRDVFLWSTDLDSHIVDFKVNSDLDDSCTDALLTVNLDVRLPNLSELQVQLRLLDPDGNDVPISISETATTSMQLQVLVESPAQWSAEYPNLYQMLLSLTEADGSEIEVIRQQVGFRRSEIVGNVYKFNCMPIKLKGANLHEHSPDGGHNVTQTDMLMVLQRFKQFNINSVRLSHYPHNPLFYDLCDTFGFYVMDEANIESHGYNYGNSNSLSFDPAWEAHHVNRVQRMVLRDINHPSIFSWSLGNEAGFGPNFKAAYDWIKEVSNLPVHYEGSSWGGNADSTDFDSCMYCRVGNRGRFEDKPFVLCEYTHAMGNSNGNLKEYWEEIYANERHAGGFVWDFIDQGIRQPVPNSDDTFLAYGGWWENEENVIHDNNFCMNGLVTADKEPHPGLHAIKFVHRFAVVTDVSLVQRDIDTETLMFTIENRYDFTQLGDIVGARWELLVAGAVVATGTVTDALDIAPHQTRAFREDIDSALFSNLNQYPLKEYLVNFIFETAADSPLVDAGHVVAFEQFPLSPPVFLFDTFGDAEAALQSSASDTEVSVSGEDFEIVFDKALGTFTSMTFQDTTMVNFGLVPDFWRGLTDNDNGANVGQQWDQWRFAGRDWTVNDVRVVSSSSEVCSLKIPLRRADVCP